MDNGVLIPYVHACSLYISVRAVESVVSNKLALF